MRIGLLGDTHVNLAWVRYAIERFNAEGIKTVFQVGDLGVYGGQSIGRGWNKINNLLDSYGMTFYVAPGNHEDYDRIASRKARDDGWIIFRSNILLAPRGHRTDFGGRSVVWLGGAGSANKTDLIQEQSITGRREWWEREAISEYDVEATAAGGHAEVMVSHEAPFGVRGVWEVIAGNPQGFRTWDLDYVQEVRQRFDQAFHAVRPELLIHGHYHAPVDEVADYESFRTRVFGLDCDEKNFSLGELSTDTLDVKHWDIGMDIEAKAWKR